MADRDSSWGKLRLGQKWGAIAHDFGRIFSVMKLGDYERMLFWAIMEYSWNHVDRRRRAGERWPDARPYLASPTDLAEAILPRDAAPAEKAYLRKKLYEARSSLKKDGVIYESDGGLLIEVDVEAWAADRLDRKYLGYGEAAQTRFKPTGEAADQSHFSFSGVTSPVDTADPEEGIISPDRILLKGNDSTIANTVVSSQKDKSILPKGQKYPPKRTPPIEERGRVLESLELQKSVGTHTLDASHQSQDADSVPPGYDATTPTELAELRAVAALCADWFPDRFEIVAAVSGRHGKYPVACYRAAAEKLRVQPPAKHRRGYFLAIVDEIAAQGGPATFSSNGHRSTPAPTSQPAATPELSVATAEDRAYYAKLYANIKASAVKKGSQP